MFSTTLRTLFVSAIGAIAMSSAAMAAPGQLSPTGQVVIVDSSPAPAVRTGQCNTRGHAVRAGHARPHRAAVVRTNHPTRRAVVVRPAPRATVIRPAPQRVVRVSPQPQPRANARRGRR